MNKPIRLSYELVFHKYGICVPIDNFGCYVIAGECFDEASVSNS